MPARTPPSRGRGLAFFLLTWLVTGLLAAVPVTLLVRNVQAQAQTDAAPASVSSRSGSGTPAPADTTLVGAAAQTGSTGTSEPTRSSSRTHTSSSSSPSSSPSSSSSTSSSTSPTDEPTLLDPPKEVTVVDSCGSDGTGDCFLTERSEPRVAGTALGQHSEGTHLQVVCQTRGDFVTPSATGVGTSWWSQVADGGYVSQAFVTGKGSLPTCP